MLKKLSKHFINIWTSYAIYYFGKVNLSLIMPILIATFGMSKGELGAVASGFLFAYAAGQFIHGYVSERFNPLLYMGVGLILSAVMNTFLGFAGGVFFLLFFGEISDGFFQSMGWSSAVRATAYIHKSDNVTTVLGTSYQIGNSIAWLITGFVIHSFGWQWGFWCSALIMAIRGVTLLINMPDIPISERSTVSQIRKTMTREVTISGISLGLLNFVIYGVIVWIPTYLFQVYSMPIHKVGIKIFLIPIAGCLSTLAYNWLSNRISRESLTAIYMVLLTMMLGVFSVILPPVWVVTSLLVLSGFFLYGPHVFLVGTTPGRSIEVQTAASATGVIDGIGYIGAMLVGIIMPILIDISWGTAFASWVFCCVAIIILMRYVKKYSQKQLSEES